MKLVAFYLDTPGSNGEYEAHAKRLRAQCKELGQDCSVVKFADAGTDYLSITRSKPRFMLEQLNKHDEDLVYVDVDSTLLKNFDAIGATEAIALAVKPNGRPYGHVVFLPNNDETRAFLQAWIDNLAEWEGGDHTAMWLTIKQTGYDWVQFDAAEEYVTAGLSDNDATRAAQAHLKSINWTSTVRERLAD